MEAGVRVVPGRLDVAVEVKVVLPHRQVAAQHAGLRQSESGTKRMSHVPGHLVHSVTGGSIPATSASP